MLKIGNINVDVPVALAPMAGVTDLPYRLICKEFGCGFTVTELISAKAILYNNKNTNMLLATDPGEKPAAVQLFGSDPDIMAEIAKRVEELDFDMIDINMGCPVPKVVNNGEGSALMKEPKLVEEIVSKMSRAVSKPVTVKMRSGFSKAEVNAVEIAKICEASGAQAVTVHARTREQYYAGEADWSVIAAVKEAIKIPVIGNGDIKDGESAVRCMQETCCDGVMIGRAARGNPWIFSEICAAIKSATMDSCDRGRFCCDRGRFCVISEACDTELSSVTTELSSVTTKPSPATTTRQKKDMLLRHAKALIDFKGEYTAVREMRKHFGWYTAGLKHASDLRRIINSCETFEDFQKVVEQLPD